MKDTNSNVVKPDMPEKCNSCSEFEAEMKTVKFRADGTVVMTETVVRCQHRAICDRIEQRIKDLAEPKLPRLGS